MSQTEMKVLREALQRIHRVAIGESTEAYMRIPADPKHDADLLLAGGLDELERLRAELEQVKRERDVEIKRALDVALEVRRASEGELARQRDSARADNARLREALSEWVSASVEPQDIDEQVRARAEQRRRTHGALAATDSREWLREFGMKVAFALEGVPVTRERRDQIAAIVDGVLK